ncbi:MAG: GAF domain-containing protein [Myxococcota bacterium]|nr:GAF domain-containing protein [Myxococcota bacterium]
MRKRIVIVGRSREGLELIPLLEANPDVEVTALVSDDPEAARAGLEAVDRASAERLAPRIGADLDAALATPGLEVAVDAEAPAALRARLHATRGVQVTTPVLARLLYAFGPADAFSKPDLLQALREILESYDLALDRRSVLDRVLQIALTATGADRASLMLWDPEERALRVEVAMGIEEELIPKIRLRPGEGIAGRAFAAERAILLDGKADRSSYQITRERDDVESAISAPLVHEGRVLGVLNLSHGRDQALFSAEDLEFVEQLARLDARLIARAEEMHGLLRESETLRAEAQVRRVLAGDAPLARRLEAVCRDLAEALPGGVARLHLLDAETGELTLQAASHGLDPIALRERLGAGEGLPGWVVRTGTPVLLAGRAVGAALCSAAWPLLADDEVLGVITLEGARDGALPDLLRQRLEAVGEALGSELREALRAARLERESRRTGALAELFAQLGACADDRALYDTITERAGALLEAQDAVLRLRDDVTGRFRIVAWHGVGQWRKAPLAALEKQLAVDAIRARSAVRLGDRPEHASVAEGVGSALVQPLLRAGQAEGSLSVLGKVPDEPLLGERFDADDAATLERLAQHAQLALAEQRAREQRHHDPTSDPVTGLPGREPLRERLAEELARSRARGYRVALLDLHWIGLAALLDEQKAGAADRLVAALAEALRAGLREFDVLARPAPDRFAVLVPEPEVELPRLLTDLSRCARDALLEHPDLAPQIDLRIGYAVHPDDGESAEALEARAARPRVEAL